MIRIQGQRTCDARQAPRGQGNFTSQADWVPGSCVLINLSFVPLPFDSLHFLERGDIFQFPILASMLRKYKRTHFKVSHKYINSKEKVV